MAWCGRTFLFPLNRNGTIEHLWVVITEPNECSECLIVSVTTLCGGKDRTVILMPGDHAHIKWPSVVFYRDIQLTTTAQIEKYFQDGSAVPKDSVRPDILKTVQDGLCASDHTAPKHLRFYNEYRSGLPNTSHG